MTLLQDMKFNPNVPFDKNSYDPNIHDPSMLTHPKPKPPMKMIYHRNGERKTLPMEEALHVLSKDSEWQDTPAKFQKASSSQDSHYTDAQTAKIVDKAVGDELRRQAAEKEKQRPESGPGAYDAKITFNRELVHDKAAANDFMEFHKLGKLNQNWGLDKMCDRMEELVARHNDLVDDEGEYIGS